MEGQTLYQRRSHWRAQVPRHLLPLTLCLSLCANARGRPLRRPGHAARSGTQRVAARVRDPPRPAVAQQSHLSHGSPRSRRWQTHDMARVSSAQYSVWTALCLDDAAGGLGHPRRRRRRGIIITAVPGEETGGGDRQCHNLSRSIGRSRRGDGQAAVQSLGEYHRHDAV